LQRAATIDPENRQAWEGIAHIYQLTGNHHLAESGYAALMQLDPGNMEYAFQMAVSLAAQKKYDLAIELLEAILRENADNAAVFTQLGIVLLMKEDFGSAVSYLKNALALEPENENARYHLGLARLVAGHKEEAIVEWQRLVMLHPGHHKAHTDLAVLFLSDAKYKEALEHLDLALAVEPAAKSLYYKAIVLNLLGKNKQALPLLEKLIKQGDGTYSRKAEEMRKEWGKMKA